MVPVTSQVSAPVVEVSVFVAVKVPVRVLVPGRSSTVNVYSV
jgi:hypothetical protein